jgi:hypothetical protein
MKKLIAVALCAGAFALGCVAVGASPMEGAAVLLAIGPLAIATPGVDVSAVAYQDEDGRLNTTPPRPQLAMHEYVANKDACLEHYIDGQLRATVPPEGLEDYARAWPDCKPVVKQLRAADKLTPGETTSSVKAKAAPRKKRKG